jgi:hypothetical protein
MVVRLISIVFLAMGVNCAFAQKDSLRHNVRIDSSEQVAPPVVPGHSTPVLKHDEPFTEETSVRVNPDQVSPSLRQTLQEIQYRGWEKGTLVQHMQTGEFRLELIEGTDKKTYYFNSNGERIVDK